MIGTDFSEVAQNALVANRVTGEALVAWADRRADATGTVRRVSDSLHLGNRTGNGTRDTNGKGGGGIVTEEQQSFWHRLFFGGGSSDRERRVLEYIIHRVSDGANLREVIQEEYVRRNASPDEVQDIIENPKLVEAAHEEMRKDFSSGDLDPSRKPPDSTR